MPAVEIVRTMIAYNASLNRRLWDSMMQLTEAQFVQDAPYSEGSLRNHIVHVAGVNRRWLRGLRELPEPMSFKPDPRDYPDRASARALWEDVSQDLDAYVAALDEARLEQTARGMNEPIWQILMHLVNHGTDHRAQMLRIVHDLGGPSFAQDFIIYLWNQGATS
jgi:uncharacterized damage-inducible protein DinB